MTLSKKAACLFLIVFMVAQSCGLAIAADEPASADAPATDKASSDQPEGSSDANDAVTMSFDGAALKDVLLLFSQKTGMNFVASQDIEQRKVTVFFEDVSPKEALDAIMTTNNLTYTRKSGSSIYMVYSKRAETPELVTKVFRLKYARLSSSPLDIGGQQTVSDMKTMASAGSSSSSSSGSEGSSGGGGGSAGGASGSSSGSQSSARGIDFILRSFLSNQGKMAVDISTNSIIITDTQEVLNQIQKMLVELDVPQQQVILEVHVMEVQKGLVSDKGLEWGGSDGAIASFRAGMHTTAFPFGENFLKRQQGVKQTVTVPGSSEDDVLTAVDATDPTALLGSQMTMGVINANNFAATLHYVMTDSKTKILARPRILTQNNEAAVIRLVQNTSIANQTETTSSNGTTTSSSNSAERSETGVTLRMTPQINSDNSVTLFMEPSVTTVGASVFFPTTFLDPTTRVVRTMARILDNQTLVIGGLIDSTKSYAKKKVPYLGDIPGLGRLFSYDTVDDQDRELVVFVTPHIVRGTNSLTQSAVTAPGRDVIAKRLLDEFTDEEADIHLSAFEPKLNDKETVNAGRVRRDKNAALLASQKASDPVVDKQMAMALDAFSPQLLDEEISKALSFQPPTTGGRSKSS